MERADEGRDLLFGLTALQLGYIDEDTLIRAAEEWSDSDAESLGLFLLDSGGLCAEAYSRIEAEMRRRCGLGSLPTDADPYATVLPGQERPWGGSPRGPEDDPYATLTDPSATARGVGETPASCPWSPHPLRFERMGPLAKGGLGAVFVAHDRELGRDVALKEILERRADDPESRARFLQEAHITGALEHPGIVPVYGLGQYPDGRPYYAMRLIQGETLAEASRRFHAAEGPRRDPGERALALRQILARFIEVCHAMEYAHSKGVIHRDIKPSNIMIGPFRETLVVDWGLAKVVGSPDPEAGAVGGPQPATMTVGGTVETIHGSSIGTPAFMSPEQAAGDVEHQGPASDIYSLGATLYTLLAGRPPFEGRDICRILSEALLDQFPPPRQVNRLVPPALEAVCLKAMSRRPEDRYPSARALAEDLERWLADEPVRARREPPSERIRRWVKQRRTLVASAVAALLVAGVAVAYASYSLRLQRAERAARAQGWLDTLIKADTAELPQILEQAQAEGPALRGRLPALIQDPAQKPRARLHLALALVAIDPKQFDGLQDQLLEQLLEADPSQLVVIRDRLLAHRQRLIPRLWAVLDEPTVVSAHRFRAGCALATYDPPRDAAARARWAPHGPFLAATCLDALATNASDYGPLSRSLQPVAPLLFDPLMEAYRDRDPAASTRRSFALNLLNEYAWQAEQDVRLLLDIDADAILCPLSRLREEPERSIELLTRELLDPSQPCDTEVRARRRGQAAIALVMLGKAERVWPLLAHSSDPSVRTELIQGLAEFGIAPDLVIRRMRTEPDVSTRRALILALGGFSPDEIDPQQRRSLTEELLQAYQEERNPGLHAAIDWLLRTQWGEETALEKVRRALEGPDPSSDRDWFVNGQGQELAIVRGPIAATIGAVSGELLALPDERPALIRIDRSYALGTREVTVAEFARFLKEEGDLQRKVPTASLPPEGPILNVSWFDAARYCNWLSRREGIPEDQWCYPREIGQGMTLPADYLKRTGYRLPTEAEWEVACRAGTATDRFLGDCVGMLDHFGWTRQNAGSPPSPHPVGLLKPNDAGFFDMLGNAWEWTMSADDPYPDGAGGPTPDEATALTITDDGARVLRGGSFDYGPEMARSACRPGLTPSGRYYTLGFRVARTIR